MDSGSNNTQQSGGAQPAVNSTTTINNPISADTLLDLRVKHVEAIKIDVRDEIKNESKQQSSYAIQTIVAIFGLLTIYFASAGKVPFATGLLLVIPIICIYFTAMFISSFNSQRFQIDYIRGVIEQDLAVMCNTDLSKEWENYRNNNSGPYRKVLSHTLELLFFLIMWGAYIVSPLFVYGICHGQQIFGVAIEQALIAYCILLIFPIAWLTVSQISFNMRAALLVINIDPSIIKKVFSALIGWFVINYKRVVTSVIGGYIIGYALLWVIYLILSSLNAVLYIPESSPFHLSIIDIIISISSPEYRFYTSFVFALLGFISDIGFSSGKEEVKAERLNRTRRTVEQYFGNAGKLKLNGVIIAEVNTWNILEYKDIVYLERGDSKSLEKEIGWGWRGSATIDPVDLGILMEQNYLEIEFRVHDKESYIGKIIVTRHSISSSGYYGIEFVGTGPLTKVTSK